MPRRSRAFLAGAPHHLTQRALDHRPEVYLGLFRSAAARFGADLLGYCLMTNHLHRIVVPGADESLDRSHSWAALRYVERNPVRAGLVATCAAYEWSSAAAHTYTTAPPDWLEPEPMRPSFTPAEWAAYLGACSMSRNMRAVPSFPPQTT
jgi:putative transposase